MTLKSAINWKRFYPCIRQIKKRIKLNFPIVKRDKLELQHKDIDWERHKYNKGLKKIAKLCNIEDNLTSYVSRHKSCNTSHVPGKCSLG